MTIQSVQRALDILLLFSATRPQLGVTDISGLMCLPKPTAHGLVQTLAKQGFLDQDPETKKYTLGLRIHELGAYLSSTLKINQVGVEPTRRLAEITRRMARLGIWHQNAVLVTHHVLIPGENMLSTLPTGPRIPAYCSAMGKAILATFTDAQLDTYLDQTPLQRYTPETITNRNLLLEDLSKTKMQGFAQDHEEHIPGMFCIGTAVFNHTQKAVGAVSLSVDAGFFMAEKSKKTVVEMKRIAMEISLCLGYIPEIRPDRI